MQLMRYSPWQELNRLERDLDSALGEGWGDMLASSFQDLAAVDIYTEDGKLTVEIALPGFVKDEIRLNLTGPVLDITAEHDEGIEETGQRTYLLHESGRSYHRTIGLPEGVVPSKAEATFGDGKLIITMPVEEHTEKTKVVPIR